MHGDEQVQPRQATSSRGAVLSYPFRLFFLLAALQAVLTVPLWLGILHGGWAVTGGVPPQSWHAHELLFGVVTAAIAGFLLTAMCTWTGSKPLRGAALAGLAGLWLLARLVMLQPARVPAWVPALLDLGFLLTMAAYVAVVLGRAGSRRNYIMVVVLLLLAGADGLMHRGFAGPDFTLIRTGQVLALDLVLLLIAVVAGRITPAFSANWLRRRGGDPDLVRRFPALDLTALAATGLLIPLDAWPAAAPAAALAALLAGVLHLVRLWGWRGWYFVRDPLLWVLHLGYAWLAAALLFKGAAHFTAAVPETVWIHAAGIGTIGTMIIGVMTRVALGHTGRPLRLPAGMLAGYWLVMLAALLRLVYALGWWPSSQPLALAGMAWSAAFAIFLVLYWRILTAPSPTQ